MNEAVVREESSKMRCFQKGRSKNCHLSQDFYLFDDVSPEAFPTHHDDDEDDVRINNSEKKEEEDKKTFLILGISDPIEVFEDEKDEF